ncbi:hypothetical protein LSAT2_023818, partial [Lamellibrachia satsuma]
GGRRKREHSKQNRHQLKEENVARLDSKTSSAVDELRRLDLHISRLQEKLREADIRIEQLEDTEKFVQSYNVEEYARRVTTNNRSETFIRAQSDLYRKLHPSVDEEMDIAELEEALRHINGHLISKKDMHYIYRILDLSGRPRINMQLFSVIAALSEKVAQVNPFVKKLINKFDFEALDTKMERSKELFRLLVHGEIDIPDGKASSSSVLVDLLAGGVAAARTNQVVGKFDREKNGVVDFLDFLTYIPLFLEVHTRIVANPFSQDDDL